jgi:hypothetical protein
MFRFLRSLHIFFQSGCTSWHSHQQWTRVPFSPDPHQHVFIAVLFTIAKLWKQPRFSTIDEWIKKMWYLYTMEFYSAMKKNEILSFTGKWMELENIILSEVSQAQKTKNCMFSLICGL